MCVGTSLLCFYFQPLCYAAVLLKFTYHAQNYAQEQELWSEYYATYLYTKLHEQLNTCNRQFKKECFIIM